MATIGDLRNDITCGKAAAEGQGILQCRGPAGPEEATSDAYMLLGRVAWASPAQSGSCRSPQQVTLLHCTKVMPHLRVHEHLGSVQSHTYVDRLLGDTKCQSLSINIMRRTCDPALWAAHWQGTLPINRSTSC